MYVLAYRHTQIRTKSISSLRNSSSFPLFPPKLAHTHTHAHTQFNSTSCTKVHTMTLMLCSKCLKYAFSLLCPMHLWCHVSFVPFPLSVKELNDPAAKLYTRTRYDTSVPVITQLSRVWNKFPVSWIQVRHLSQGPRVLVMPIHFDRQISESVIKSYW